MGGGGGWGGAGGESGGGVGVGEGGGGGRRALCGGAAVGGGGDASGGGAADSSGLASTLWRLLFLRDAGSHAALWLGRAGRWRGGWGGWRGRRRRGDVGGIGREGGPMAVEGLPRDEREPPGAAAKSGEEKEFLKVFSYVFRSGVFSSVCFSFGMFVFVSEVLQFRKAQQRKFGLPLQAWKFHCAPVSDEGLGILDLLGLLLLGPGRWPRPRASSR